MINTKRFLTATAIAAALVGSGVAAANVGGFDDVPDDHTHAEGIQWLVDNGITSGCDADSFCPSQSVSRAQMATFMMKLADVVEAPPAPGESVEFELVQSTMELNDQSFANAGVDCPAGTEAVSGGYVLKVSAQGAISSDWYAPAAFVNDAATGYDVSLRTLDGAAHDGFVEVTVTCAG
jgi:hypothetical protein